MGFLYFFFVGFPGRYDYGLRDIMALVLWRGKERRGEEKRGQERTGGERSEEFHSCTPLSCLLLLNWQPLQAQDMYVYIYTYGGYQLDK